VTKWLNGVSKRQARPVPERIPAPLVGETAAV
jgi:hypothetical protein